MKKVVTRVLHSNLRIKVGAMLEKKNSTLITANGVLWKVQMRLLFFPH